MKTAGGVREHRVITARLLDTPVQRRNCRIFFFVGKMRIYVEAFALLNTTMTREINNYRGRFIYNAAGRKCSFFNFHGTLWTYRRIILLWYSMIVVYSIVSICTWNTFVGARFSRGKRGCNLRSKSFTYPHARVHARRLWLYWYPFYTNYDSRWRMFWETIKKISEPYVRNFTKLFGSPENFETMIKLFWTDLQLMN